MLLTGVCGESFVPEMLLTGVCGESFVPGVVLVGCAGRVFRGSAAGRSAVGEYFRGRAAEGPHSERVYVRPQSLRRPLVNRGTNFACNSLQGISNVELRSLKFCRFWLLVDASSARIACDFWRAGEVCSDHWPHGGL